MSWTSEFEPPPPRPALEPEDYVGDGIDAVDHGSPAPPEADTGAAADGGDSFGDGPLDPSVFDGLFDDLNGPGRQGGGHTPEPLPAFDPEPGFDPQQRELVVVDPLPAPVQDEYNPATHGTNDSSADEFTANSYVGDDFVVADDFQEVEIVESSDQILHEAIQRNPDVAEPSIGHRDPAPYEPSELDNLDAEYQESIRQRTSAEDVHTPPLPPMVHYDPVEQDPVEQDPVEQDPVGQDLAEVHPMAEVAQRTGNQPLEYASASQDRRWPAFLAATVIGASLGVVGALVLFQTFRLGDEDLAAPAPAPPVVTTSVAATEISVQVEAPEESRSGLAGLAAAGRFELNTIQFVSGTVELTKESQDTLAEAVAAIAEQPDAPLSIDIRTFSELTPSDNRELSGLQGLSIQEHLIELGIPADSIKLNPLGAAPFGPAQPVQTFVVPSTGLDGSSLRSATKQVSPFAIGLDPVTNQLRPESLNALDLLGETMALDVSASLSLAAYSYSGEGADRNREMASIAAEAAAAFLVTNHDIDRARISILTPGQTPYVVGAEVGNHVFLEWGEGAAVAQDLQATDLSAIAFTPASSRLSPEIVAVLDEILAVVAGSETTLVIGVHTATERSDDANAVLSVFQAEAIVQHLTAGGIGEQRVRAYGIGNLRQFGGQDVPSAVIITALP